eukprot:6198673-Amphidinium_carterae.1
MHICGHRSIRLNRQRPGARLYTPRSLLVGAYTTQGQGVARSCEHQWVRDTLDLVLQLARLRPTTSLPKDFLGVNINQNDRLPAHRDRHNLSITWLASFGDHRGGSLWLEAVGAELIDRRSELRPLPPALQGLAPDSLLGFVLPIRNVWTCFSGLRWHAIMQSQGPRLSVSLFSPRHLWRLTSSHWALLAELGFQTERLR